jgi:SAM-dependent methyltransferase
VTHRHHTVSATVYDTIYGEMLDYDALAARMVELIDERAPHAETLLEVACGTGLYLEQLRHRFDVHGLDLSDEMLAVARDRLPEVPLHRGDMRTMDLGAMFDVVACLGSSVAYCVTIDELRAAYERFAAHVRPGGLVIVEPWLTQDAWTDDHLGLGLYGDPSVRIARMVSSSRDGTVGTLHFHHLVGVPGEGVDYFVEEHVTGLFTIEAHLQTFTDAGLDPVFLPDEGGLGRGLYLAAPR